MNFAQRIRELHVEQGTVAVTWLGQAGYLLKSPTGQIVMIDPYLSDWAMEQWGVDRIIPPVFDPLHLHPDILLISHWHEDHFDEPVVKQWAKMAFPGPFAGPLSCSSRVVAWGWPDNQVTTLSEGDTWSHQDVSIIATYARHDTPTAPCLDAIGFIVDIGGVRIWDVADSEYDAHLRVLAEPKADVAFFPINGVGGNMNAHEAALLAWQTQPRIAVPMHYNMWKPEDFGPGATLDPATFTETLDNLGGGPEVRVLEVGKIVIFDAIT